MKFSIFSQYLQKLEGISSRLQMTTELAELFRNLEKEETVQACYLLQGQLLPQYESLEFQIAVKTVIKACARLLPASGTAEDSLFAEPDFSAEEEKVTKQYQKLGDLGLVVEVLMRESGKDKDKHFSVVQVYEALAALAKESGGQSQQRKLNGLVQLLQNLDAISAKFVVRIILGRLRLGFSDMTMLDALSWAMCGSKAEHDPLENAYQKKADIGKLAQLYLSQKDERSRLVALEKYEVEVGVPVIPALCQRLNTAAEIIEKMHEVIAEPKYDGLRVQIHVQKKQGVSATGAKWTYKTFTRNLEETSHMFPELIEAIKNLKCESCILDSEAIGYDPKTGDLLPFQETMQRKRKHDVSEKAKEIPVRFYVFDILYLDGRELIQEPLRERKEVLKKVFADNEIMYHPPELRTVNAEELHHFHEVQLAEGLEGVVIKQIDAPYQSGRKGWSWVKIKETEGNKGKLSDTLDVVVMGYYFGRGKRTDFGIGAFLVGILNEKGNTVVTLAKIGTGLSDEALRETKKRCDALKTETPPAQYVVNKMLTPDVWCLPGFVVEVAADELTTSPLHSAGVALRFPRLVQFRDDKEWQQATTTDELKSLMRQ